MFQSVYKRVVPESQENESPFLLKEEIERSISHLYIHTHTHIRHQYKYLIYDNGGGVVQRQNMWYLYLTCFIHLQERESLARKINTQPVLFTCHLHYLSYVPPNHAIYGDSRPTWTTECEH